VDGDGLGVEETVGADARLGWEALADGDGGRLGAGGLGDVAGPGAS
jgi:hypothetical protein